MIKKIMFSSLPLFVVMLFTLCFNNLRVYAQDTSWQEDYVYALDNENSTITLTEYKGAGGDVVIPASALIDGNSYQVVINGSGNSPFFPEDNIVSFTANDGVKFANLSLFFYYHSYGPDVWTHKMREKLTSVVFGNVDTSQVTNMSRMFDGCQNITRLDLSNIDTSNVENMDSMFNDCYNLQDLDVSGFNTRNVTSMFCMFQGCASLTKLELSSFDTSSVTSMSGMFCGCSSLLDLNLSSFDTSSVTSMSTMFTSCRSLKNLNLSSFDTSAVTNMYWMFACCESLSSLDLSSFDISKVTLVDGMFSACGSLVLLKTPQVKNSLQVGIGEMYLLNEDGSYGDVCYRNLNDAPVNAILATIKVSEIILDQTAISIYDNERYLLNATVYPADAASNGLTWTSSDTSVATVSSNGIITAVSAGTATIKAEANDESGKNATCTVTVLASNHQISEISLYSDAIVMRENETYQPIVVVYPEYAASNGLIWTSSDTSVATVSSDGIITAVSAGTATITAKANDEWGRSATCFVRVFPTIPISEITLCNNSISIKENGTYQLRAVFLPINATNKSITWTSSDTSVATVSSNGFVTAVSVGTCIITVNANDGSGKNAVCTVTVQSSSENDNVDNNDMIDFSQFKAPDGCVFQYRLYNPNSGEHFYTGSQEETINLVEAGWHFEGSGFITPTVGIPIYRLYSEKYGDHFYTTDESERDALLADNWTLDGDTGIAFPSATEDTGRPMFRLYNPNAYPNGEAGAHHFTMSWEEVENLETEGWQYEFIAWYSI